MIFRAISVFRIRPFLFRAMIAAKKFYSIPDYVYAYRKGHQVIKWDEVKVEGAILGLTDNLLMSKSEGLTRLHDLTYTRFLTEFFDIITKHAKGSWVIYFSLLRFIRALDPKLINNDTECAEGFEPITPDFAWSAFLGEAKLPAKAARKSSQEVETDALRNKAEVLAALIRSNIDSWNDA